MDALASEPQFIDHLAPVWRALPESSRGRFIVSIEVEEHARRRGIEAEAIERPRNVPAYPQPRFDGPPLLVASYGDVKVGRRLGYGPFAFLEHGAGQSYGGLRPVPNGSYAGGPDREDNELVLVPSEACAAIWRRSYPDARVEVVGCPKLDELPARVAGPGPVVAISFHWPAPFNVAPEAGTLIGEYQGALAGLAKRFTVIGHAHPKGDWPQRMTRYYRRAGIPFVADFEDVCRQADVYVCDNSSTSFEFAATGRPVVLLNGRRFRRSVSHGLRFWDAAHVGVNVDRPEDLVAGIEEALADPPEQRAARDDALGLVYGVRSGGAEMVAAAIAAWLESREQAAA